ncbi:hypothetical protein C8R47DRAFT_1205112 [Mycena vitilis]|nr:hypothetical protein C8R47DRAFT_1205112 [Mycena vitilis]
MSLPVALLFAQGIVLERIEALERQLPPTPEIAGTQTFADGKDRQSNSSCGYGAPPDGDGSR